MLEFLSQGLRIQIPPDVVVRAGPAYAVDLDPAKFPDELAAPPKAYGDPYVSIEVSDLSRVLCDGEPISDEVEAGSVSLFDHPWTDGFPVVLGLALDYGGTIGKF